MHAMNAAVAQGAVAGARRMLVTCQEQLPQLEATLASLGLSPTPKHGAKAQTSGGGNNGGRGRGQNRGGGQPFFPAVDGAREPEPERSTRVFAASESGGDVKKTFLPELASTQGFEPSPIGPFHRMLQTGGVPSAQEVLDSIDNGSYGFPSGGASAAAAEAGGRGGRLHDRKSPPLLLPNIQQQGQEHVIGERVEFTKVEKEIDDILGETPDIGGPPTTAGSGSTSRRRSEASKRSTMPRETAGTSLLYYAREEDRGGGRGARQ